MLLYKQKVELYAGDKKFTSDDFDIDFKVEFGNNSDPNVSEIYIYNLTNSTIAEIKKKAGVILNAGYEGNIGNILTGKIEKIWTYWEGVDKITHIYVGDGTAEVSLKKATKTYKANTTSGYIIADLVKTLGLESGEIKPAKNITYKKGRTFNSTLMDALKGIVKETGSRMFIDKEKIYIRPATAGTTTGFVLNSETGLIESPERVEEEEKGKTTVKYKVKCLLNYQITTDSIIQVKSKTINGNYKVVKGTHSGDFITECEVTGV